MNAGQSGRTQAAPPAGPPVQSSRRGKARPRDPGQEFAPEVRFRDKAGATDRHPATTLCGETCVGPGSASLWTLCLPGKVGQALSVHSLRQRACGGLSGRDHRAFAGDRRPVHDPAFHRIMRRNDMHGAAVVPHEDVIGLP